MHAARTVRLSALLVLGSLMGFSQTVSSSILGIVVDPAGSVIPGAEIKLTNQGTAAATAVVSDSAGFFRVTNIFAGSYTVTVQAKGFKALTINEIPLGIA